MLRPARNRPRAGDRRAPGSQARPRRRPLLLDLEPLESRRLLTGPITVTTNDGGTGAGTLYAAIEEANSVSPDVITPSEITFSGPMDIQLQEPLPTIIRPVIIDGFSAGGGVNTDDTGDNASIPIEIDGSGISSALYPGAEGLVIQAYNCTVDGLSITGFSGSGVDLEPPASPSPPYGAIGTTLWSDWIGVTPGGTAAGNGGAGVIVACSNNVIGGTLPSGRNLFENSADAGVVLCGAIGAGNLIQGSFILDNGGDGVLCLSANNVIGQPVGSLTTGAGNVISGNTLDGVLIRGPSAQGNIVANDEIGTTTDGSGEMPNQGNGVRIEDAPGNVVGGTAQDTPNVIGGNAGEGVLIENDQGDALPAVPTQVSNILVQDNISYRSPADRATANQVEGNLIGYNTLSDGNLELLPNLDGVFIASAGNTVGGTTSAARNVIISNLRDGVVIAGDQLHPNNAPNTTLQNPDPNYNVVEGNDIGTQGGGDDYGNTLDGILLLSATANTIGGTASGTAGGTVSPAANVISGNNDGIVIATSTLDATAGGQNLIEGNLIGTTSDGLNPLPNAIDGIRIDNVPDNTIGAIVSSDANVISGNKVGVHLLDPGATGNAVWGNLIGSDISGLLPVRNSGIGVLIEQGASNNSIGGRGGGEGNTIAFNTDDGVEVNSNSTGSPPVLTHDDPILSNSIFSNGTAGTSPGSTSYDGPVGIALVNGGNDGLSAPTISQALPDKALSATQIDASLINAQANAIYLVQFFSTPSVVPQPWVEGETFIGSTIVKSGGGGTVPFTVNVPTVVASKDWVTATATLLTTDPTTGASLSETSPFTLTPVPAISPFLVTSTVDLINPSDPDVLDDPTMEGTLRYAIAFSNQNPAPSASQPNTIDFQIPGAGLQTISLVGTLTITNPVIIDGYSQPGSSVNDSRQLLAPDTTDDQETDIAVVQVQLDGSQINSSDPSGLVVQAPDCTIDGLVLTGFGGAAIALEPSSSQANGAIGDTVWGSFIGVSQFSPHTPNLLDFANNPNANGVGVLIQGSNNLVGGTDPWDRNIIQGNSVGGVVIEGTQGTGNTIASNFILDNGGDGVLVLSSGNHIGEASGWQLAGGGNLISGNQDNGVHIMDPQARGNTVANNEIGTDVGLAGLYVPILGTQKRPNGQSGVLIEDAPANTIGGLVANSANVLAGNVLDGVAIENLPNGANSIGLSTTAGAIRNVVEGNLIGLNERNGGVQSIRNQEDGVNVSSSDNFIGGASTLAQNTIADNGRNGITVAHDLLDNQNNTAPNGWLQYADPVANVVEGNFIGTVSGNDDGHNAFDGILIDDAGQNIVGGTVAGAGNVVSNNQAGIVITGSLSAANLVAGNMVGTSSTGTAPMGNLTDGITIDGAAANTIGGTVAAAANVIAGNTDGIHLTGVGAAVNLIEGNFIGTNTTGANQIGNSSDGVRIDAGASSNTIGGTAAGTGNVITLNGGVGVDVLSGVGNTILSNSMASNDGGGISLSFPANANDQQAAPTIGSVTPLTTATLVSGELVSTANTRFLIQIFSSTVADVSGSYEGQTLVGTTTVTADDSIGPTEGLAKFSLALPASIPFGAAITATATSLATGDTSEFSQDALNAPLIQFSTAQFYVSQPASSAVITITRNTGVGSSTVVYSAGPGTAIAGEDFTAVTAALTFAPGQTSATFSVPIIATQGRHGDSTVNLALSHPTGGGLGSPATSVLTITSSPGTLQFTTSAVTVPLSAGGVVITVDRVRGAAGTATVNYAAAAVDAVPGQDYQPVSGTLTFAPGVTEASFTLPVLGNSPNPNDATIALTLTDPTGGAALGSPTTELVTIDKPLIMTGQQLAAGRGGITSVTLSFNKRLAPSQATNLANFGFFVYWANASGVFGNAGKTTSLASATYNPAARSITLTPAAPLPLGRLYHFTVDGSARAVLGNGLSDLSGGVLAGSSGVPGTPYVVVFGAGPRLTYLDSQGNTVTLQLRRGGLISFFQRPDGVVQRVSLIGAVPGRSTLSGSVKRGPHSKGRTTLPPIAGAAGVRIRLKGGPFAVSRAALVAGEGGPFARRAWHR